MHPDGARARRPLTNLYAIADSAAEDRPPSEGSSATDVSNLPTLLQVSGSHARSYAKSWELNLLQREKTLH